MGSRDHFVSEPVPGRGWGLGNSSSPALRQTGVLNKENEAKAQLGRLGRDKGIF